MILQMKTGLLMLNNVNLDTSIQTRDTTTAKQAATSQTSFSNQLEEHMLPIMEEQGVGEGAVAENGNTQQEQMLPATNTAVTTTDTGSSSSGFDTSSLMSTMMQLMQASMSMGTMSMLNGSGSGSDSMSSVMSMMMMVLLLQAMGGSNNTEDASADNSTASAAQVSDAYTAAQNAGTMEEKAAAYSDIIDSASQKYGVDSSLIKGIIQAESSFNERSLSSAGAQGLMQLMPGTAATVGVTDSYDPAQNIDGGTNYISQMIDRYNGDVKLALVAYNCGPGRVAQDGVTSSSDANYANLPKAARDYADKVLAYASNYATAAA